MVSKLQKSENIRKSPFVPIFYLNEIPVINKSLESPRQTITDSVTNKVYIVPTMESLPLSGEIFCVLSSSQNLCYYLIFTQALIEKLNRYQECNSLKSGLSGALRMVGPKGERGFNLCDKKATQLKLDKISPRPVNLQYKDPESNYRIWGEHRTTKENTLFYVMHTLVKKTDDAGKSYKIF